MTILPMPFFLFLFRSCQMKNIFWLFNQNSYYYNPLESWLQEWPNDYYRLDLLFKTWERWDQTSWLNREARDALRQWNRRDKRSPHHSPDHCQGGDNCKGKRWQIVRLAAICKEPWCRGHFPRSPWAWWREPPWSAHSSAGCPCHHSSKRRLLFLRLLGSARKEPWSRTYRDATGVLTASRSPCHFLCNSGISNLSAQQLFEPIKSPPCLCHNYKFMYISKSSDKTWVFWADLAATPMVRAFSPKAT